MSNQFKPVFQMSDQQILVNLHLAGLKTVNSNFKIVNSGYASKNPDDCFNNKNHLYEVGIVASLKDAHITKLSGISKESRDTIVKQIIDKNESEYKRLHQNMIKNLKTYFTKFAGSENSNRITEKSLKTIICTDIDSASDIDNFIVGPKESVVPTVNDGVVLYKFGYSIGLNKKK